ncbi:MAG TPA: hypothetical protein VFQ86_05930 [Arachidicoccus soli]|nr:hypothetical protein [Arachidicoccus soli]
MEYRLPELKKGVEIGTVKLISGAIINRVRYLDVVNFRYYSKLYPFFMRARYRHIRALNGVFNFGCPIVYFNKNVGYINDLGRNRTQIKINARTGDVIRYRQDGRIKGIRGERWEMDVKNLVKMGLIFEKTEIKQVKYSFSNVAINKDLIEFESYLLKQYGFVNKNYFELDYKKGRRGWEINMLLQNQININESDGFKWLVIGSKFKLYKLPDGLMLIKCFNFGLYYNEDGFYAVQDLYGQIYNVGDKDRKLLNDWVNTFRNGISYEKS